MVYFRLEAGGHLDEYQTKKPMQALVTALALGPVPEGRTETKFLVRQSMGIMSVKGIIDGTLCGRPWDIPIQPKASML